MATTEVSLKFDGPHKQECCSMVEPEPGGPGQKQFRPVDEDELAYCYYRESDLVWKRISVADGLEMKDAEIVIADSVTEAEAAILAIYPTCPAPFGNTAAGFMHYGNRKSYPHTFAISVDVLTSIDSIDELQSLLEKHNEIEYDSKTLSKCAAIKAAGGLRELEDLGIFTELAKSSFWAHQRPVLKYLPSRTGKLTASRQAEQLYDERLKALEVLLSALESRLPSGVSTLLRSREYSFGKKLGQLDILLTLYSACHGKKSYRQLPSFGAFVKEWPRYRSLKLKRSDAVDGLDFGGIYSFLDKEVRAHARRPKKTVLGCSSAKPEEPSVPACMVAAKP